MKFKRGDIVKITCPISTWTNVLVQNFLVEVIKVDEFGVWVKLFNPPENIIRLRDKEGLIDEEKLAETTLQEQFLFRIHGSGALIKGEN